MVKRNLYLQWDSTNECNLNCSHCYHVKEGNKNHFQDDKDLITYKEAKLMIDDLKRTAERWHMIPRIAISGGEPILRKDNLEILGYANEQNVLTAILTNGTLISSKKAKELRERNVGAVQVSIDGTRETHNLIRGRNFAYDKAMDGIKNSSKEGLEVTVAMTIMQSNKNEFENVIQNSIEVGATKVGFKTYVPDSNLGIDDPEFINASEICDLLKKNENLREKYKDKLTVLRADVLWQIFQKDHRLIRVAKEQNKYLCGCSAGFRILSVLSDGTVYPCRRLPIQIGHISEGINSLILENEVMKDLRNLNKIKENSLCDKVVHCRGCRAIAYAVTGDYLAKDPMCFKHLLEKEND